MKKISDKIVEQAKKHYRSKAYQQTHFQLATKAILSSSGIMPYEQGYYFAFNDQIFSLTSKFGNGLTGKQTVRKTAYVFCAHYVAMLGTKFNLTICNKILALYSIPAYSPYIIPEIIELFPILDIPYVALTERGLFPILDIPSLTLEFGITALLFSPFVALTEMNRFPILDIYSSLSQKIDKPASLFISEVQAKMIETRYMRGIINEQTTNGLTAYLLGRSQSNISKSYGSSAPYKQTVYCSSDVVVRHIDNSETTISTKIAEVSRSSDGTGLQSASWTCPLTSLALTDAIIIRTYIMFGFYGTWILTATFITEQIGASQLKNVAWTFYYYMYRAYEPDENITYGGFYWGTSTHNSRITNFTWSVNNSY